MGVLFRSIPREPVASRTAIKMVLGQPSSMAPQNKKTCVKQPKWKDLHILGAVQFFIRLLQAPINASKQKCADWYGKLKVDFDR